MFRRLFKCKSTSSTFQNKAKWFCFVFNLPRWPRWSHEEIFKKNTISPLVYFKSMQYEPRGINIFTWQLFNRTDARQQHYNFPIFNHQNTRIKRLRNKCHLDSEHLQFCQVGKCCSKFKSGWAEWYCGTLSSLGWWWCEKLRVVCWLAQVVDLCGWNVRLWLDRRLRRVRWLTRGECSLAVRHWVGRIGRTGWTQKENMERNLKKA